MKLWCSLKKKRSLYEVECRALHAVTQGRTKKEAYEMMGDWVRTMLDQPNFFFDIAPGKDGFFIGFDDIKMILGLMLSQLQVHSDRTVDEIAELAGYKSRNAFYQYRDGKHEIGLSTMQRLLSAYGYEISIELVPKKPTAA